MGADLIWNAVKWPRTETGEPAAASEELADLLIERVKVALPTLDTDAREDIAPGEEDLTGEGKAEWEESIVESLSEFIRANFGSELTRWRDCDIFAPEDAPWVYLFTACMSWGNATDAFDPINTLVVLDVTTEPVDLPAMELGG